MKLKSSKGFSLIELLIVVAIMTILATIAAPSFNKYRYNTQLKDTARDISGQIQLYRQKAMTENLYYLLWIYTSGQDINYRIYSNLAPTWSTWQPKGTSSIKTGGLVILSSSPPFHVVFDGHNFYSPYVIFMTRGTLPKGEPYPLNTIKLKHIKTNSTADIYVNSMGKASVTYDLK